jgi:hypothetical protein
MAFGIARGIGTVAGLFAAEFEHDVGASASGVLEMAFDVIDGDVHALCAGSADFVGLLQQTVKVRLSNGAKHDDAAAIRQFGICNRAVRVGDNIALLETESRGKPIDCGCHIPVTDQRYKPVRRHQ